MAISQSSNTSAYREALAAAAVADSVTRTPDYHLPYTGEQVQFAIKKILELDLNHVGGIIILPSSENDPAWLDNVTDLGHYIAIYVDGTGLPDEVKNAHPVIITNFEYNGILFQTTSSMGDTWYRFSKDGGETWSKWYPKSTTSGGLPTEWPEGVEPKDMITIINEKLDDIYYLLSHNLNLAQPEIAQAMLEKRFDYDTQQIASGAFAGAVPEPMFEYKMSEDVG